MILEVNDLEMQYDVEDGKVHAVDGVSFTLQEGETLGLVGESGSGKTSIAKSILRLLPQNGHITSGEIRYKGEDVNEYSDKQLRKEIRWDEISMIPQNAMDGFDPVYTVGDQIVEAIQAHESETSASEARERARSLFEELGIEPDRIDDYPHQFSGGMAQRAMIALALACQPSLLLADEPTTALDVVIQDRIMQTIEDAQERYDAAMILITHDISVVAETCDRVAVVYGGRIVELGDISTILESPRHPYTLGLRNAFPDIGADDQDLISIPGTPPELKDPDEGCRFAPRCPFAEDECWERSPEPEQYEDGHWVECHRADEMDDLREEAGRKETWLGDDETPEESLDTIGTGLIERAAEEDAQ